MKNEEKHHPEFHKFVEDLRPLVHLGPEEQEKYLYWLASKDCRRAMEWLDDHRATIAKHSGENLMEWLDEVFYIDFLGTGERRSGYTVMERSEKRLAVALSHPCPVLEACEELGLDTVMVCSKGFHRQYQAFLSGIHPDLRFSRDYMKGMRPKTNCCVVIITQHEKEYDGGNGLIRELARMFRLEGESVSAAKARVALALSRHSSRLKNCGSQEEEVALPLREALRAVIDAYGGEICHANDYGDRITIMFQKGKLEYRSIFIDRLRSGVWQAYHGSNFMFILVKNSVSALESAVKRETLPDSDVVV